MLGLIKADIASTRKPHLRDGTPSLFLNFRALNALLFEGSHFDLQIVTHEIKFVSTTLIGRVDCGFSRRQGENQPAMTCIHGFETKDIAEKYAICLGILTVDNYVSTRDHLLLQQGSHREHYGTPLTCFDLTPLAAYPWGDLYGVPRRTMQQALSVSAQLAKGEDGTLKVDVSRIGVSISPSSFTWVEPTTLPKALPTKTASGTFSRKRLPEWGKMAVTPVRTSSPRIMVVCPTSTPATSVTASSGPAGRMPIFSPKSWARGLALGVVFWATAAAAIPSAIATIFCVIADELYLWSW